MDESILSVCHKCIFMSPQMDTVSLTRPHWNGVQAVLVRRRESAGLVGWDMWPRKEWARRGARDTLQLAPCALWTQTSVSLWLLEQSLMWGKSEDASFSSGSSEQLKTQPSTHFIHVFAHYANISGVPIRYLFLFCLGGFKSNKVTLTDSKSAVAE